MKVNARGARIWWWLLLGLTAGSAGADPVDDTVRSLMEKRDVPGVSIAVIEGGAIVRTQGYGVVEAGLSEEVSPGTLFQAASVSKPVAALGALRLVESGALTLDANVNDVLKSWKVPDNDFTAEQKVTLRRLLSHSAGLTVHGFPGYASERVAATVVQILDGKPPANTAPVRVDRVPGSRNRYSGGGYTVLQQMMMDVTGQAFPAYMRSRVLAPLQMSASTYEQPLPAMLARRAASAHTSRKPARAIPGRWHVYPEMAAAGLWTTPADLARFALAIQEAYAGKEGAILGQELTAEMLTPQSGNFGLGLVLTGEGVARRFEHGGRNEGFDCHLVAYVEGGRGAVVMINANENSGMISRIIEAIADHYGWPEFPKRKPAEIIEDTAPEITAKLVDVLKRFASGADLGDLATEEMKAGLTPHRARIKADFSEYGAVQSVDRVQPAPGDPADVYRHRVAFAGNAIIVRSVFKDGKMSAVSAQPE